MTILRDRFRPGCLKIMGSDGLETGTGGALAGLDAAWQRCALSADALLNYKLTSFSITYFRQPPYLYPRRTVAFRCSLVRRECQQ
jgi:hypothetical protein